MISDRYPDILKSAAISIELGSDRAVELGALLVGNFAFEDTSVSVISGMDLAVHRLVGLMVSGGDRARELGTLALANLTCQEKLASRFLAEEGAVEVLLSVAESGKTGRAREAAQRVVHNVSVLRLMGKRDSATETSTAMPLGKNQFHSLTT